MAQAFLARGADVFMGWSKPVRDRDAGESARFWVDSILGQASLFQYFNSSEEPTESSLWTQAIERMETTFRSNGVMKVSQSIDGCVLRVSGRDGTVGPLRPRIEGVSVSEQNNRTTLTGKFGSTRGKVFVMPSNAEIPVRQWSATSVSTDFVSNAREFAVEVNGIRSKTFSLNTGNYRLESANGGAFEVKESMTVWVGGTQVFSGTGPMINPISFQGVPGQLLRLQVKSEASSGGTSEIFLRSPISVRARIRPNALDLLVNPTTRIVFDQTFILQE